MTEQKIGLICDSGANLSPEMRAEHQVEVVPLQINFSDRSYSDGVDLAPDDIYPMMEKELPKSSLPKAADICAALDALKERGCTEALFITISSGLSGCFQLVTLLAAEYAGMAVKVFDSKTLACGEQILVLEAARALLCPAQKNRVLYGRQNIGISCEGRPDRQGSRGCRQSAAPLPGNYR